MAHSVKKLPDGTLEVNIDDALWQQQQQEEMQFKQQWDNAMQGVPDDPDAIMLRMMQMFGQQQFGPIPGMPGNQDDQE